MNLKLQDLIGETTAYDKKEAVELARPKSWLKSVCAFANGSGGMLLFGLKEDNTPIGITDVKEVSEKSANLSETVWIPFLYSICRSNVSPEKISLY